MTALLVLLYLIVGSVVADVSFEKSPPPNMFSKVVCGILIALLWAPMIFLRLLYRIVRAI